MNEEILQYVLWWLLTMRFSMGSTNKATFGGLLTSSKSVRVFLTPEVAGLT